MSRSSKQYFSKMLAQSCRKFYLLPQEVASMSKQASGGKARAESLSSKERSAIAKKGADARWRKPDGGVILATHAGTLVIGDKELACANLPDGRRVIAEKTILAALGRGYSGYYYQRDANAETPSAVHPNYLGPAVLKEYISDDLTDLLSKPIAYALPDSKSTVFKGIVASALVDICSVWIRARAENKLKGIQLRTATQAEIILMGLAKVGIDALVDEATGYQTDRDKEELQKLLQKYLSQEALKWMKAFPIEFFNQIYRLRGWKRPLQLNAHSPEFGKIINKYVYDRLPEGVHKELRKRNPKTASGYRRYKHHQFLTDDIGQPDLQAHLQKVIGLMQASLSWEEFKQLFGRVFFPNAGNQPPLGFDEDTAISST